MAKFIKLTFNGLHDYHWNGVISNAKIESEEELKKKIDLIQVGEIVSFPTEATPNSVMLGGISLRCLQWRISIVPNNFIDVSNIHVKISGPKLVVSGELTLKINLKDECEIDFNNNLDKIYIDEISIWNVESYSIRNPYTFTITGDWQKDKELNDNIQKGISIDGRSLSLEIHNKKPK